MAVTGGARAIGLTTPHSPWPRVLSATATAAASNTATAVAASNTGQSIVGLSVCVSTAATTPGVVALKDGASGTIIWQGVPTNTAPIIDPAIPGGELFRGTANTLLQFTNAGTGGTAYINIRYIYEDP